MNDKRCYEGMFLVDAGKGEFEAATGPIRTVLDRSEAELLSIRPWDERRLTYEIKGRKRALYVLTYFKLDPTKVPEVERDVQLSEEILRALLLRRDHLSDELLNAPTPAMSGVRRSSRDEDHGEKKPATTTRPEHKPDSDGHEATNGGDSKTTEADDETKA